MSNCLHTLKGFRHSCEIISYAVWAYLRFSMSLRDAEDLLVKRGIIVSYETIRVWVDRFSQQLTRCIRRDRPAPNDNWHLTRWLSQ
ncbi:Mobile element protein [Pseudomonas synxantha]|uniref:Mobile element protein n=1 Tax=Pseudomonas synxantha TaxID=47883 RepID=A0A3G7UC26_9PSED|nr:Mobile element protein [Pseudomonas synxantha]